MLTQQRVEYHIVLIIRVHVPSVRRDRPQFHRQGVPGISVVVHSVIVTPRSCRDEGYMIIISQANFVRLKILQFASLVPMPRFALNTVTVIFASIIEYMTTEYIPFLLAIKIQ